MLAPFPINPAYVACAVAYKNEELIADYVLPRVPVAGQKFAYNIYALENSFKVPETLVGRTGTPNQVVFRSTEQYDATEDHGLDSPVPNSDVENWVAAVKAGNVNLPDPRNLAATETTDLILLRREKRAADLVFNTASYGANNKIVLSGDSQWDDPDSDPEGAINDAFDVMIMRPTIGVFGRRTWSKLSRHKGLRAQILGSTSKGVISRREFADHFELRDVFVGAGWLDVAAKGQAAQMVRVWGNHAAFLHQKANVASTQQGTTFGLTAQWGGWIGGDIPDPNMGVRGGVKVRVAESVKEKVLANDLGYLFVNAVNG